MSAKALVIYLMSGPGMPELAEAAGAGPGGWPFLGTPGGPPGPGGGAPPALAGLGGRPRRPAPAVPLYAGFGISTPEHAVAAAEHTDGVVVGSRAVQVAEEGPAALRAYVASLREALGYVRRRPVGAAPRFVTPRRQSRGLETSPHA